MQISAVKQSQANNIKTTASKNVDIQLSSEQKLFIDKALKGDNILVDACIGSGKTTSIQKLCDAYPTTKRILYLTYNKLLKLDAKSKIKNSNVTVTNYHGYAYSCLMKARISVGVSDIIQAFIKYNPPIGHFDVLIIDEYQDIEQEFATMLEMIKDRNPGIQIIAVGDMKQKVYDKTTLDVTRFIEKFLGNRMVIEFTQCFRLPRDYAAKLGRIWDKNIVGVNQACEISTMKLLDAVEFLSQQDPSQVLCLGARYGDLSETLNILEQKYPEKFNKNTIYASIREDDAARIDPRPDTGIFTTFDSSKGLEKEICMIFDYTEDYWYMRIRKPQVKYDILRNIFCVAASRGKKKIIFVEGKTPLLEEKIISTPAHTCLHFDDINISEMFDFKYKEDVEKCFKMLNIEEIETGNDSIINVKTNDGFIDLSPCIGINLEASFFDNYSLVDELELTYEIDRSLSHTYKDKFAKRVDDVQGQVLVITAAQTHLQRYMDQVKTPFVNALEEKMMHERLESVFDHDENVQQKCEISIDYMDEEKPSQFSCKGYADVVKDETVYELKFVSELKHEHFLQCACYMVALGLKKSILWNIKSNKMYQITINDADRFIGMVIQTVTKGYLMAKEPDPKKDSKKQKRRKKAS